MAHTNNSYLTSIKNDYSLAHHDFQTFNADLILSETIDYKTKTFQLIKQVASLELKDRKNQQTILSLQRQLFNMKRQMERFFKEIEVYSYQQAKILINKSIQQTTGSNDSIIQQMQSIISEYKKLIQSQQLKTNKLEQQCLNYKDKISKQQYNSNQLREQLQILTTDCNKLFVQNQQLKCIIKETEIKCQEDAQYFQLLEKKVQEKLENVYKEIQYYQIQRKQHVKLISKLRAQINNNQQEKCFSFGGVQSKAVQTDQNQQGLNQIKGNNIEYEPSFSQQCYEASIKTLLQQNTRLKDAMLMLYKSHTGEVPKEIQLELKILLNMEATNKIKNNQKQQEAAVNFIHQERKQSYHD